MFLVNPNPKPNPNPNPNPNQQTFSYNYFSWIMPNIWKLFSLYLTHIFYITQFEYTCFQYYVTDFYGILILKQRGLLKGT